MKIVSRDCFLMFCKVRIVGHSSEFSVGDVGMVREGIGYAGDVLVEAMCLTFFCLGLM